jgi:hypothetical protein
VKALKEIGAMKAGEKEREREGKKEKRESERYTSLPLILQELIEGRCDSLKADSCFFRRTRWMGLLGKERASLRITATSLMLLSIYCKSLNHNTTNL